MPLISLETLAVVFDFDDTLVPDSTTILLEEHGIKSKDFWLDNVKKLVQSGYDPAHAYLKELLANIGPKKPLGELTNDDLRRFGKKLDNRFFPGVFELFSDLQKYTSKRKSIEIKFYIISGGLQEIIEGTRLSTEQFASGIYGSQLAPDDDADGMLKYIKRCITFTEKTRYLFEINKGVSEKQTRKKPYSVNKDVAIAKRAVPFRNMIYIGDGLTDIPCFSLVGKGTAEEKGGTTFGVFDPKRQNKAKRALVDLIRPRRVINIQAPEYRKTDTLGSLIRATIASYCTDIVVRRRQTEIV